MPIGAEIRASGAITNKENPLIVFNTNVSYHCAHCSILTVVYWWRLGWPQWGWEVPGGMCFLHIGQTVSAFIFTEVSQ